MAKKIYGAGTIVKLANGKWKWRGYFRDETTGAEHRPTKTFNTRKEAEEYRETACKTEHRQKNLNKPKMTVQQAYAKWQTEVWKVDGNLSDNTKRGWVGVYKKHILPLVGNSELQKIDSDKIQRYYNKLKKEGLTHKTIKNINQAFDALLKFCIIKKLLDSNPLDRVIIPKDNMKKRAEATQFVDAIKESEYALVKPKLDGIYQYALQFIAESGIRPEEIALRYEDINYASQEIYIRRAVKRELTDYTKYKTRKVESEDLKSVKAYRTIPMTASLYMLLEWQREMLAELDIESAYVFPNSVGNIIEQRNLLRSWHNACKKAGIEIRGVKSLRKLYITRRVREGMDPKTLQHLVGHESITTTLAFYQILDMDEVKNEANKADVSLFGLSVPTEEEPDPYAKQESGAN